MDTFRSTQHPHPSAHSASISLGNPRISDLEPEETLGGHPIQPSCIIALETRPRKGFTHNPMGGRGEVKIGPQVPWAPAWSPLGWPLPVPLTPSQAQEALADKARADAADDRQVGLPGLGEHPAEGGEEEKMKKCRSHSADTLEQEGGTCSSSWSLSPLRRTSASAGLWPDHRGDQHQKGPGTLSSQFSFV